MIPCLESAGGSCQDASILVEVHADTLKFVGALDGTALRKVNNKPTHN